jgi:hypothetical protein
MTISCAISRARSTSAMMPAEYAATAFALLDGGRLIAYLPPIDFRASADCARRRAEESRAVREARRVDLAAVAGFVHQLARRVCARMSDGDAPKRARKARLKYDR